MDLSQDSQSLSVHSIASAASSNITFPILPPETKALIEDIITSLPNDAHTFDHIFTRYKAIVASRNLDLGEDDETYASLLKLGMQRGATWKEKWSNAQRAIPGSSNALPSLDILRARLDSLDATTRHDGIPKTPRLQPIDHRLHTTDEGYMPSRKTPEQRRYRDVAEPMTSTPSRPRTAPLSFQPSTLRQQSETPSTAQVIKPRVTFLSPTRPSHHHHHDSESFNPPSISDYDSEPETASPSIRFLPRQPISIPPDPRITQADQFRSYSLLSRSLDIWSNKLAQHHRTLHRTQLVRDRILVKRALAVWKLKLRLMEEVLQPKAEAWSQVVLARKAIRVWREMTALRRKRRWEESMRLALERVERGRSERLVDQAWEVGRKIHASALR